MLRLDEKQVEWSESDRLPWIQVTPRVEMTELNAPVPFEIRSDYIRLTNTGRTPAYNVTYSAEFANSEHPLTDFFLDTGHGEFEVIGPGKFVDIPIRSPELADQPYPMVRILWRDSSGADRQFKGASVDLFWPASPRATAPNADYDVVNLTTPWGTVSEGNPGALIRYYDMMLPWPHGVTPFV